ncbi:glycoside hydrolase family 51 protein [Jaapia argillacea MUCL 33604]|uniref:non-reducing end alpha-L-arabinofuranosidase n=1 Tax=Jaapia argillacea MUCL 33604 TaxID=933084 RepID=A0A067PBA9_9AGAM|nr:glycoside hydrolase family 51 protein [Jaapia argillacea MUCL 33604]
MFGPSSRLLLPLLVASLVLRTSALLNPLAPLNLQITKNATVNIPPTLYGYMWEDINHSGDGGLYAELLQNRAFQGVLPGTLNALNAWQPYNGPRLSVTSSTPGVSAALPNSLQVQIPAVVYGPIGFENTGYWGIKVQQGWTYTGSFYAKSDTFCGAITASLRSSTGTTFASATLSGISSTWQKFTFTFNPTTSAPDINNVFHVEVDGQEAAGQTIYFGMFSLFPPTFRGRKNGMRIDLAEALAATQPSVWRFPGGNNLEGASWDTRWKWNETIGPLESRPGRVGDWGYPNTDGLGLLEYLNWAEDLGAEPILGIWSGISIQNYSDLTTWPVVPEADLQPYIDDAINQIEFITADASTNEWGALRASLGREQPYALQYIEVGNEDQFQPASYAAYRWNMFVTALSAQFPNLQFIATTYPSTALNPPYMKIDFHEYNSPSWFEAGAFMFDNYPRNGTQYFVGEYAVTSTNDTNALGTIPQGRLAYPSLAGSTAEAAFMTGMERNSDVVFASAYAPSLQHIMNYQWTPDIITYDAGSIVKSTSYYVQQMFSVNRGTQVLATSPASTNDTAPLYWVASHNNVTNILYLKVSNTGPDDLTAYLFFDFNVTSNIGTSVSISSPALSPISGQFNISNTLTEPQNIIPVASSFALVYMDKYNYTFPATSVTVLSFEANWSM